MEKQGNPQFFKEVRSKEDATVKFIFRAPEIIEFSYINKSDGKDIICAPTQTSCNLGCKFCFLTDFKLKVRNLLPEEITNPVEYVVERLNLLSREKRNCVLLISFMGCGEPLLNLTNVITAAKMIREKYADQYDVVRFAIATLVPKPSLLLRLIEEVRKNDLAVKLHLSLHTPFNEKRRELMPSASGVQESVFLLGKFREKTGNSAEIHYAMINGVNDRDEDLSGLISLFGGKNIPIKFLIYNEKPSLELKESTRVAFFREELAKHGIVTEFYIPPGRDVGSSCGQFLLEYYLEYNQVSKK
ncbi:MAG: radical SAM protein [Candidatus Parcubacteria bacterium]|nr:radical SAM protein [Candidatus Parcubacteria bacterium]